MMERVHHDALAAEGMSRPAAGEQAHRVTAVATRGRRVMVHPARALGRQVLIERAAHRDVHHLDPPADAEDRHPPLPGRGEERQLEDVALAARRGAERGPPGALTYRVPVLPPREGAGPNGVPGT